MEGPQLPLGSRYSSMGYLLITALWWVGVWGLADTVIHLVFKGATLMELGVYISMIAIVLFAIHLNPEIAAKL